MLSIDTVPAEMFRRLAQRPAPRRPRHREPWTPAERRNEHRLPAPQGRRRAQVEVAS